jgi:hypothetical protein
MIVQTAFSGRARRGTGDAFPPGVRNPPKFRPTPGSPRGRVGHYFFSGVSTT